MKIILHLQSFKVYLKFARLIFFFKFIFIVVITINVGKLICLFYFAIVQVLIFPA